MLFCHVKHKELRLLNSYHTKQRCPPDLKVQDTLYFDGNWVNNSWKHCQIWLSWGAPSQMAWTQNRMVVECWKETTQTALTSSWGFSKCEWMFWTMAASETTFNKKLCIATALKKHCRVSEVLEICMPKSMILHYIYMTRFAKKIPPTCSNAVSINCALKWEKLFRARFAPCNAVLPWVA